MERLPCYITSLQQRLQTSQKPDQKWNYPHSLQLRLGEIIPAQPDYKAVQASCSERVQASSAEVSSSFHHRSGHRLSAHLSPMCFLDIPWTDVSHFQLMDLSSIKIVFISMQLGCSYFLNFGFQLILVGYFLPVETANFFELCCS